MAPRVIVSFRVDSRHEVVFSLAGSLHRDEVDLARTVSPLLLLDVA